VVLVAVGGKNVNCFFGSCISRPPQARGGYLGYVTVISFFWKLHFKTPPGAGGFLGYVTVIFYVIWGDRVSPLPAFLCVLFEKSTTYGDTLSA
jgi:hypothetical protein